MRRTAPLLVLVLCAAQLSAGDAAKPTAGDALLADYFKIEVRKLEDECLNDIETLEQWLPRREKYRQQLFDMLGLTPLPERGDLKPVIAGTVDHEHFTVEKIQFQSLPGLYVTGNLYIPKRLDKPAPAILYVCGHSRVVQNGVLYGSKANYQHHPAWYARHGYVSLVIDMFWFSEIEGIHHGTFSKGMWWWNSRGYTPAGVETWNAIRALDYLATRKEVDAERFGVTGRSGGGAYSWYLTALDDRIKAAVPVAGITDTRNHVVDHCIEGHCDCMYMVNTYRWDYPLLAALAAPRPLLISNTDKDGIFPLEGVVRVHEKTRRIYQLYKATDKLGLLISEGPHKDTQDLQVPSFRWFNRFLKKDESLIEVAATKPFKPEQLKVFAELPKDERNTTMHEHFVKPAPVPALPETADAWRTQRGEWLRALRTRSFAGWPEENQPLDVLKVFSEKRDGIRFSAYDFSSQDPYRLRLFVLQKDNNPKQVEVQVLDEKSWAHFVAATAVNYSDLLREHFANIKSESAFAKLKLRLKRESLAIAFVAPRAIGPTAWSGTPQQLIHKRRRFMLLGQTLAGMQVWDVRRAIQTVREVKDLRDAELSLTGSDYMAGVALYASLFEPRVHGLTLQNLPRSHMLPNAPDFLNVLRIIDVPQAAAMAAERMDVRITGSVPEDWQYPLELKSKLNRPGMFVVQPH